MQTYIATVVFETNGPDQVVIEKILGLAKDLIFDTFRIDKLGDCKWVTSMTACESVSKRFVDGVRNANMSVIPGDPKGSVEIHGIMITRK